MNLVNPGGDIASTSRGGCGSLQFVVNYTGYTLTRGHGFGSTVPPPTKFPVGYQLFSLPDFMAALAMNDILIPSHSHPIPIFVKPWYPFTVGC